MALDLDQITELQHDRWLGVLDVVQCDHCRCAEDEPVQVGDDGTAEGLTVQVSLATDAHKPVAADAGAGWDLEVDFDVQLTIAVVVGDQGGGDAVSVVHVEHGIERWE